jgi:small-conductance mechanosensitive channel
MTTRRMRSVVRMLVGIAMAAALAAPCAAQGVVTAANRPHTLPAVQPTTALVAPVANGSPVVIAGDTLFRLYGHLGAFSAEARAAAVTERLRSVLETVGRDRTPITVTDHESGSELAVGDKLLMTILDADAAPLGRPRAVLLLYVYVPLVLSFFPWTTPLSRRIVAYALPPFAAAWAASVAYLPNLFYLAAGVIIARYALKFVRSVFAAMGSGAIRVEGFHRDWADPTYKIARVMVLAFAVMALYPFLPGAGSDAFKGVSIFLGVFFSLGSSAAIGNVVAGVVLTYTNAFRIGDRVKIGDTVGDVVEKTLLVTRLCTIKNIAVTIPNGAVLGSQIVNYSTHASAQGLILHTAVTIGYNAPWRQVHALLIDAARATEDICEVPPPFVLQTSLDDFYVTYEINACTDRADRMAGTYSRLHQNIQDGFNAAGVEIMSPHYSSQRDGNEITIPAAQRAPDYRVPGHRVTIERADPPHAG